MPIGSSSRIGRVSSPNACAAASRPCSNEADARLGKPITSPTA